MTTLDDLPPAGPATGLRAAAMRCIAFGRTAQYMRDQAEDVLTAGRMAARFSITLADARDFMIAISVAVEVVEAEGITPEQCYFLLRLDETHGPWTGIPVLAA